MTDFGIPASLCTALDSLLAVHPRVLLALDGRAAAGKSILAAALAQRYDANVYHMDDFFLRFEQRTPQRYAEPGGNVDRERFSAEVLTPLQAGKAFSYTPFECSRMALAPQTVAVQPKRLEIVEGAYSMHPAFGAPYTLTVFCTVCKEEQRARILRRGGEEKLHRFEQEWIPLEEAYLRACSVPQRADLTLTLDGNAE